MSLRCTLVAGHRSSNSFSVTFSLTISLTTRSSSYPPRRHRAFPQRKSRDVGCYLGLQPGRRNSGESEPQMHISKEGDPYLRTLLVQGAHHILGPFGADSDPRGAGV